MKMFDSYGNSMVDIVTLTREDDDLVVEGKIMGSMPGKFYIRPEEVWSAIKLLSWSVVIYMPIMLIKGWRRSKRSKQPKI